MKINLIKKINFMKSPNSDIFLLTVVNLMTELGAVVAKRLKLSLSCPADCNQVCFCLCFTMCMYRAIPVYC